MTTPKKAGRSAAASAPMAHTPPTHYLRRLARSIVLRAALNGRLSWHVALPVMRRIGGEA